MSDDLEVLFREVTAAIGRALEADGSPEAPAAYRGVSEIEERIARMTEPTTLDGEISRRGAVMAAVSAMDFPRAESLAAELGPGMDVEQQRQLETLLPTVAGSEVVDASLRDVIVRSRASCVAPTPCPALQQASDGLEEAVRPGGVDVVVLVSDPDDVPEAWTGNGLHTAFTFDEYAARLRALTEVNAKACENRCVALGAAQDELRDWIQKLRGDNDLVVIKPGR